MSELPSILGELASGNAVQLRARAGAPISLIGAAQARQGEPGIVGLSLTGYLDTEVRSRALITTVNDPFRWTFAPGIDRKQPLRSVPAALRIAIAELPSTACQISLGWVDGDRRHHLAPGRASLGSHLGVLSGTDYGAGAGLFGSVAGPSDLVRSAAGLGSALASIAAIPAGLADELSAPSGPDRLARWLRSGEGTWAAEFLHDRIAKLLGNGRIDELIGWVDEMGAEQVVHGRAGLSAVVVPESDVPPALLLGDEIGCGPADFDLAWVLGDFLVRDHLAAALEPSAQDEQRELIRRCRDAFLVAYGPARDLVATGRAATLRVLVELHDAAAFRDQQLTDLALEVPDLIDAAR